MVAIHQSVLAILFAIGMRIEPLCSGLSHFLVQKFKLVCLLAFSLMVLGVLRDGCHRYRDKTKEKGKRAKKENLHPTLDRTELKVDD